jgi:hypothetical protein
MELEWLDILRAVEGGVVAAVSPFLIALLIKAWRRLTGPSDSERADLLDRLAVGLLEDVVAEWPEADYRNLLTKLILALQTTEATPTRNPKVLSRVAASAIRSRFPDIEGVPRRAPLIPPA